MCKNRIVASALLAGVVVALAVALTVPRYARMGRDKNIRRQRVEDIQELTRAWADYNEMIARINSLVFEKLGKD